MAKLGRYSANRIKTQDLTAAYTVKVADCGTLFTLNSATEFAVTLPSAADMGSGWWCEIWVKAAPSGTDYTVVTSGSEVVLNGNFGVSADAVGDTEAADATTITFVDGAAKVGDWVRLVSDGSKIWVSGHHAANGGITITG